MSNYFFPSISGEISLKSYGTNTSTYKYFTASLYEKAMVRDENNYTKKKSSTNPSPI